MVVSINQNGLIMNFIEYYKNLDEKDREAFADKADTTVLTVERKYLNGKNVPRREKLNKLIAATRGEVSRFEMLDHFYPSVEQGAA